MNWKDKYIVGLTAMSLILASPLSYAADDDVVVFGEQFEDQKENVTEVKPEDKSETPVETPPANQVETPVETQTEPQPQTQTEESNQNENQNAQPNEQPTEKVEPVESPLPETQNLNEQPIESQPTETPNEQTESQPIETTNEQVEPQNNEEVQKIEPVIKNQNVIEEDYELGDIYTDNNQEVKVDPEPDPIVEIETPVTNPNPSQNLNPNQNQEPTYSQKHDKKNQNKNQQTKVKKARFVKLLSDDTYDYYLDRNAVRWVQVPYSTTEYMADVWIRMIEKNQNVSEELPQDLYNYVAGNTDVDDEITDAAKKGIIYDEVDVKVIRTKKYLLEHYYLRPNTHQIQFLCELEVVGRPQNSISERPYDNRNWENLIPGSVESSIYDGVLSVIGTGKSSEKGHMKLKDKIEEYVRISIR